MAPRREIGAPFGYDPSNITAKVDRLIEFGLSNADRTATTRSWRSDRLTKLALTIEKFGKTTNIRITD